MEWQTKMLGITRHFKLGRHSPLFLESLFDVPGIPCSVVQCLSSILNNLRSDKLPGRNTKSSLLVGQLKLERQRVMHIVRWQSFICRGVPKYWPLFLDTSPHRRGERERERDFPFDLLVNLNLYQIKGYMLFSSDSMYLFITLGYDSIFQTKSEYIATRAINFEHNNPCLTHKIIGVKFIHLLFHTWKG